MKAEQSGGSSRFHRLFVFHFYPNCSAFALCGLSLGLVVLAPRGVAADPAGSLEDFAQVYVDRYFPPPADKVLSEEGRKKGEALAHYALGKTRELQGRPFDAVESYLEVLETQPDQVFLARKAAYLLARSGRQEEALATLEKSLASNPTEPFAHIALSEFLATYEPEGSEGKARGLSVAEEAVIRFPDEPAVYDHLSKLYLVNDRRADAQRMLESAARRKNTDSGYWLSLGRIAGRTLSDKGGASADSVGLLTDIYGKALQYAGEEVAVVEQVGDFYHATSQFDDAVSAYTKVIAAQPDNLEVREKLARVYGGLGDDEKIVETLRGILEIDSQSSRTLKQIAGIHLRREEFKEAIPYLVRALAITKGSATEYSALGRMMIESREHETAVKFLANAAYLFPDSTEFPFLLTFAHSGMEQWPKAIEAFEKTVEMARKAQPELLNEIFYYRFAVAREQAKQFDEAGELFQKTIELLSKNEDADDEFTALVYNYLGYMWLEIDKNIDQAGELIKTAVELDPESGAIADSLGWFHFKKGNFEQAKIDLLRAEGSIETPDPVIYDHLGQAHYALGEKEKAVEYMEKAVELDPDNTELKERLSAFKSGAPLKPSPTPVTEPAPEAAAAPETSAVRP